MEDVKDYNVHIVGSNRLDNELLHNFLEQSTNPSINCFLNDTFSHSIFQEKTEDTNLVLWDCKDPKRYDHLKKLGKHIPNAPERCYIACINAHPDHKIEKMAINIGVNGVFYENDTLSTLKKGINAILNGELWFSRVTLSATLSSFLINNSCHPPDTNIDEALKVAASLTKREREVLRLIPSLSSNEEISEQLYVSPFTVKAHLRNIYRKIKVPNRVQAIFWLTQNYRLLED